MATTTKISYGTTTAISITMAALATDSGSGTFVGGQESTYIDNSADLAIDCEVGGFFTTHATVAGTANTVLRVHVYAQTNDTPTWPVGITGSNAVVTFSNQNQRANSVYLGAVAAVQVTTANIKYEIPKFSVASLFGGMMPKRWGLFVSHNIGQSLHATAGNHGLWYTPKYLQTV